MCTGSPARSREGAGARQARAGLAARARSGVDPRARAPSRSRHRGAPARCRRARSRRHADVPSWFSRRAEDVGDGLRGRERCAGPNAALTALRLRDCSLPPAALTVLASSGLAAPVSELAFHRCDLENLEALATEPLPALRRLEFEECRAGHLDRLASAAWLPTLYALRVIETHAPNQLRQLLTSRRWRALGVLHLRVRVPDGDVAAIASSQIASKLVELEIQ